MKKTTNFLILYLLSLAFLTFSCQNPNNRKNQLSDSKTEKEKHIQKRVDSILRLMTVEEKIGQLVQVSNPYQSTGAGQTTTINDELDDNIRQGKIGSFLNLTGAAETERVQRIAVEETRLGIPLIFSYDVIHGYNTIFPIPLAQASSWDMELIKEGARVSAIETAAAGVHWTFAPMIDISRDPRWGRIMESAGEDPYLTSKVAVAATQGYQGDDLADINTIAACAKHFLAYGAAIGGRDYYAVDISERMLREVYMPPFKAASDAGVATFMSSFNTINGVPASGNRWLLTDVLRDEWGFKGFVVSDWNSVGEMIYHGSVEDPFDAGYQGFTAGVDMDMMGLLYTKYMLQMIEDGLVSEKQLDESVKRILRVKFLLGLFDDPFKYCNVEREKEMALNPTHIEAALDAAKKSIVLLKNENDVLPLSKNLKKIAVIGPLAKDKDAAIGNWRAHGVANTAVSLYEGITATAPEGTKVLYAKGCDLVLNEEQHFFVELEVNETDRSGFKEAIKVAQEADVVILALGETAYFSGECRSYADITLPGVQADLVDAISKTGKPVVMVLFNGRPLVITEEVAKVDAVVNGWLLGLQSGNALADVLFGKYNPSGKLPVSFPYSIGQIPVHYDQLNSGRPIEAGNDFSAIYRDIPNEPLFAFGHGLSYTTFDYTNLELSSTSIKLDETLKISASIKNTGSIEGEEVVQLYIRDLKGKGVSRPLKQLKGFEKISLKAGESKTISFTLSTEDLAFYRLDNIFGPEVGEFEIFIGSASNDIRLNSRFELK
jgi:beta-glucosidase